MTDGVERRRRRASLMLVLVTVLWGMSFVWTRSWQLAATAARDDSAVGDLLSALTLIAVRMPLALLILGLWQPRVLWRPTGAEHRGGAVLGAVFFAGFALQTWGLAYTTPALSAFFTCLSSAWVPLVALLLRERVAPLTLLGLVLGLAGCAVLVDGWHLGPGEWLTLLASLLFTAQVFVLDRLGRRLEPAHLTAGFLGVTGLLAACAAAALALAQTGGLTSWLGWAADMLTRREILWSVAALVVLPTVLGFHWMNTYQPQVPPSRAALIYLLEPVFSSAFSVWWGHDTVTTALVAGGGLILLGNLLVELPRWLKAPHLEREDQAPDSLRKASAAAGGAAEEG